MKGKFKLRGGTDWSGNSQVHFNDIWLRPTVSQRVCNHSPDGFAWGYGGSGPAQLALAVLLEAGLPKRDALRYHQDFKRDHIAPLPECGFDVEIDLAQWLKSQK